MSLAWQRCRPAAWLGSGVARQPGLAAVLPCADASGVPQIVDQSTDRKLCRRLGATCRALGAVVRAFIAARGLKPHPLLRFLKFHRRLANIGCPYQEFCLLRSLGISARAIRRGFFISTGRSDELDGTHYGPVTCRVPRLYRDSDSDSDGPDEVCNPSHHFLQQWVPADVDGRYIAARLEDALYICFSGDCYPPLHGYLPHRHMLILKPLLDGKPVGFPRYAYDPFPSAWHLSYAFVPPSPPRGVVAPQSLVLPPPPAAACAADVCAFARELFTAFPPGSGFGFDRVFVGPGEPVAGPGEPVDPYARRVPRRELTPASAAALSVSVCAALVRECLVCEL